MIWKKKLLFYQSNYLIGKSNTILHKLILYPTFKARHLNSTCKKLFIALKMTRQRVILKYFNLLEPHYLNILPSTNLIRQNIQSLEKVAIPRAAESFDYWKNWQKKCSVYVFNNALSFLLVNHCFLLLHLNLYRKGLDTHMESYF